MFKDEKNEVYVTIFTSQPNSEFPTVSGAVSLSDSHTQTVKREERPPPPANVDTRQASFISGATDVI